DGERCVRVATALPDGPGQPETRADAMLLDGEPERVVSAIDLARETMRLEGQNAVTTAAPTALGLIASLLGLAGSPAPTVINNGTAMLAELNSLLRLKK